MTAWIQYPTSSNSVAPFYYKELNFKLSTILWHKLTNEDDNIRPIIWYLNSTWLFFVNQWDNKIYKLVLNTSVITKVSDSLCPNPNAFAIDNTNIFFSKWWNALYKMNLDWTNEVLVNNQSIWETKLSWTYIFCRLNAGWQILRMNKDWTLVTTLTNVISSPNANSFTVVNSDIFFIRNWTIRTWKIDNSSAPTDTTVLASSIWYNTDDFKFYYSANNDSFLSAIGTTLKSQTIQFFWNVLWHILHRYVWPTIEIVINWRYKWDDWIFTLQWYEVKKIINWTGHNIVAISGSNLFYTNWDNWCLYKLSLVVPTWFASPNILESENIPVSKQKITITLNSNTPPLSNFFVKLFNWNIWVDIWDSTQFAWGKTIDLVELFWDMPTNIKYSILVQTNNVEVTPEIYSIEIK